MFQVFDANGRNVAFGKQIARGGEGIVYELQHAPDLAAKIYLEEVGQEKASKLKAMAQVSNSNIAAIAAWPIHLLYDKNGRKLKGFLMPKIKGHRKIHELYSPAHRKQLFPNADWKFLVHVARNFASAVDTIHSQGHVIGDVNQKGILVHPEQATVKLIDCDSFQIQTNGSRYLCGVGVKDYTPPELQARSFHGIQRTTNHDNFGLAVICFQLLFMGRHPFAGRFSGPGDDSIERAISEYRFAYGRSAAPMKMTPPPNSLPLSFVPAKVANLFETAFGQAAALYGSRPTANEWVKALDTLEQEVRSCNHQNIHKYPTYLSSCPWCDVERTKGLYFFISITTVFSTTPSSFNVQATWARICSVQSPGSITQPSFAPTHSILATPLPPEVRKAIIWRGIKIASSKEFVG